MADKTQSQKVIIEDVHMGFGSMVVFQIKWVVAAIPAILILGAIGTVLFLIMGTMFVGFIRGLMF